MYSTTGAGVANTALVARTALTQRSASKLRDQPGHPGNRHMACPHQSQPCMCLCRETHRSSILHWSTRCHGSAKTNNHCVVRERLTQIRNHVEQPCHAEGRRGSYTYGGWSAHRTGSGFPLTYTYGRVCCGEQVEQTLSGATYGGRVRTGGQVHCFQRGTRALSAEGQLAGVGGSFCGFPSVGSP